ncbi:MAG: L,D-transpeptidase family protein [Gemmatimonadota bacterium]|nr:L,D-transpeptidase family protein [Gemmatimonadota bacterium]
MTNYRLRAAGRLTRTVTVTIATMLAIACIVEESDASKKTAADSAAQAATASADLDTAGSVAPEISAPGYNVYSLDTAGLGAQMDSLPPLSSDPAFTQITASSAVAAPRRFPLPIPNRGPVVLQLQVMLDRAGFSPGIIDGTWGKNAAKALRYFRAANAMDTAATKTLDKATYDRLAAAAQTTPLITTHEVTMDDMEGPFLPIPDDVYEQAKLKCLCYSSPAEQLAEQFHTSEAMLRQLNPKVNLKSLAAGMSLQVPNVQTPIDDPATRDTAAQRAAKIVISKTGFWTQVMDGSGKVVAHFPSTLGAGYDPSPTGGFRVTNIAREPSFHYQPALFAEVPDTEPKARLPPGPNSPVGVVWMALSKPHYGIHGTSSPETIGYSNSHGCVRLTNWDADRLASLIRAGTPVEFQ